MKEHKQVIDLLQDGAQLIRDLVVDIAHFRVITQHGKVLRYPLALLDKLKDKGLVKLKEVCSFHSRYVYNRKRKDD